MSAEHTELEEKQIDKTDLDELIRKIKFSEWIKSDFSFYSKRKNDE